MDKYGINFFKLRFFLLFLSVPLLFYISKMPVRAGGDRLVATTESIVSTDIYHHHSAKCSETINYRCRGKAVKIPSGYFENERMYRVECTEIHGNGYLSDLDPRLVEQMHEDCTADNMTSEEADAFINEHWKGGYHDLVMTGLHCGLEEGEKIGKISILHNKELQIMNLRIEGGDIAKVDSSFNMGTVYDDDNYGIGGGELYISYDSNGKYIGTYTYRDVESGEEFSGSLEYVITHLPITVKYSIDGVVNDQLTNTMQYGGALPPVSKPVKKGYRFMGYYMNGVRYYDENCQQVNGTDTGFPDMSVTFTAQWVPEEYTIEYAGYSFKVKYDSSYRGIIPDPSRAPEGYELDKFCIGDVEPFNNDGSAKYSSWVWTIGTQGVHSVTEVWKARHFELKYGDPDSNGGEVPGAGSVEYDAAYPKITPVIWNTPKGHELEGIYFSGEKLYDEKGEPLYSQWKWVPDSGDDIGLENNWKPKVYRIYHGPVGASGKPAWSADVEYGSSYPGVKIYTTEVKNGYKVDGLFIGDEKIYDGKGEAVGLWLWDFEERELYPEVRWVAKSAKIKLPGYDEELDITYDSDYPPIPVPEPEPGMVFEGYYLDDDQVYDAEGKPTGKWRWDISDGARLKLKARWTPKKYSIFFGPDHDGDGVGDLFICVTYGEPYPAITPPVYEDGEVFDGFYINGEMVYDRNGNPNGVWRWDPEEYPLEAKTHILPPPPKEEAVPEADGDSDKSSDHDKDGSNEEDRDRENNKDGDKDDDKDSDKDSDKTADKDNNKDNDKNNDKDGNKDRDGDHENERDEDDGKRDTDKDNDKDKDGDKDSEKPEEHDSDDSPDKEAGPDKDGDDEISKPAEPEPDKDQKVDELDDDKDGKDEKKEKKKRKQQSNVSEQSDSDRSDSDQNDDPGDDTTANSGRNDSESNVSDPEKRDKSTSVSENAADDEADGDEGNKPKSKDRRKSKTDTADKIKSDMHAYREEMSEFMLKSEDGDEQESITTVYSGLMDRNMNTDELMEQLKGRAGKDTDAEDTAKAAAAARKEKVMKVAKAGAVTAGSAAGVAAVYAGLVYLFGMAEIYSICPDGRKKRLGKLAISEEGDGFMVNIGRNILNACETDKLNMRLSAFFVSRNKDKEMIINNDGRRQQEYIRREIVVAV